MATILSLGVLKVGILQGKEEVEQQPHPLGHTHAAKRSG